MYMCINHAHFVNVSEQGIYEEVLNKTLKGNNSPTIKIPFRPSFSRDIGSSPNKYWKPTEEEENREMDTMEEHQVETHEETEAISKIPQVQARVGEPTQTQSQHRQKRASLKAHNLGP